jgi:hypothetical protein
MKATVIAAAFLGVLLGAPTLAPAQEHDIEHLVIEMANTPQEHLAGAQHYTMKAAEARDEVRRHEGMARLYGGGRNAQPQRGRQHCENLAKNFEDIAVEYEELAKLHQEMGKGPAR